MLWWGQLKKERGASRGDGVEDRKLTEGQRIGKRIDWKGSLERSQNRDSRAVSKWLSKAWVRGNEGALRAAVHSLLTARDGLHYSKHCKIILTNLNIFSPSASE